jgi:hypothetical protein
VPIATIEVEHFSPTSTAIYAIDVGGTPNAESEGRIVFERGVPTGASAALSLSTAGSGGPWTSVTDGDVVTIKQQTYHLKLVLSAPANQNVAPRVSALGIEFRTPVDVTAEATVTPIAQEIDVPFMAASIGEGSVSVVRTGARDFRDQASDLATSAPVSQLEVDVRLGSRHPLVTRDAWMLIDRAAVNNRAPSAGAEQFGLLSVLKNLKQKIPARTETFSTVHTVTASVTSGGSSTVVTVTPAIPLRWDAGAYTHQGYFMRVRQSHRRPVWRAATSRVFTNIGAGSTSSSFVPDHTQSCRTISRWRRHRVHSARYARPLLKWVDADPADIWWEILTVHLLWPAERIGRGDMGHGARAGLPPRVEDIEPDDDDAQAQRLVTIQFSGGDGESGADLINQLSFLLGGATVDIGGQIVFRQIYPLRNAAGAITVAPDPVVATFDVRNTIGLQTPTGLEQRITQLACNYGVDTTAGEKSADAAQTTVAVDVDAKDWLDTQPVDDMAPASVPDDIARWCFNSADGGLYLASKITEMVVRACSTGVRLWPWSSTETLPRLVVGDRVTVITDQYTDYDPSRAVAIRGLWAFQLVLVSVAGGGRAFRGFMLGLTDALQIKGGPGHAGHRRRDERERNPQRHLRRFRGQHAAELRCHVRRRGGDALRASSALAGRHGGRSVRLHRGRRSPAAHRAAGSGDGHFRFTLAHPVRGQQRFGISCRARWRLARVGRRRVQDHPRSRAARDEREDARVGHERHGDRLGRRRRERVGLAGARSDLRRVAEHDAARHTTVSQRADDDQLGVVPGARRPRAAAPRAPAVVDGAHERRRRRAMGRARGGEPRSAAAGLHPDRDRIAPTRRSAWCSTTDTDSIRVTVPSGKTKTWNAAALLAAGSPVVYTVGDLLDDATTESALAIDEKRGTYLVEYTGGGQTVTIAPPFVLSGALSSTRSSSRSHRARRATASCGAAAASWCRSTAAATARRAPARSPSRARRRRTPTTSSR